MPVRALSPPTTHSIESDMSFIAASASMAPKAAYPLIAACLLTVASMRNPPLVPLLIDARPVSGAPQGMELPILGSPAAGHLGIVRDAIGGEDREELAGVRDEPNARVGEVGNELGERDPPALGDLLGLVPYGAVPHDLVGVLEAPGGVVLVEVAAEPRQRHPRDPELLGQLPASGVQRLLRCGDDTAGGRVPVARRPVLGVGTP